MHIRSQVWHESASSYINRDVVYRTNAILNNVTGLVILLSRSLYKPLRQKVLVAVVFSVGSL